MLRRTPLRRWRRPKADQVDPEVALFVLNRDSGCVAVRLGESPATCVGRLTIDHVRGQPPIGTLQITREGGRGKRAPSDPAHMVSLCVAHHTGSRWATSHRSDLRDYLRSMSA